MLINDLHSGLPVLKALASPVRISIIELLIENNGLNMNEIATALDLSNSVISMHIKKLEESGLIQTVSNFAKNGLQKNVYIIDYEIFIDFRKKEPIDLYEVEIGVGQYNSFDVTPTCGMSTDEMIIGEFDNPQVFADPQHINAEIVWLTSGYLEYWIPNYTENKDIKEIQISFEIGSEAPFHNKDWPSKIDFFLNDKYVGFWESPGDIGGMKYKRNPNWWPPHLNQYGFLKLLRINEEGSFIDGRKISDITVKDIQQDNQSPLILKFSTAEIDGQSRGLTLFGKKFGKYDQAILARIITKKRNE